METCRSSQRKRGDRERGGACEGEIEEKDPVGRERQRDRARGERNILQAIGAQLVCRDGKKRKVRENNGKCSVSYRWVREIEHEIGREQQTGI